MYKVKVETNSFRNDSQSMMCNDSNSFGINDVNKVKVETNSFGNDS